MTSPYYDPKMFLLEHDLDKEVVQQTLEILEFIFGDHDLSLDRDKDLKQMYIDVIDKYRSNETISIEAVKAKIAEQGYEYLLGIFEVSDENLRILASYLPLIQILKGTRPGLELIFTILNVGFEIKEWWQDPSNLEILSYILFVELINQPVTTTVVPRLKEFSRQYVYPLLTQVLYAITYKLNKTPFIGAIFYSKTELTVWQEFLWLIWAGDGSPQDIWTDQYPYQDPEKHRSLWQGNVNEEMTWDTNAVPETAETGTWSSVDNSKIRTWKFNRPEDLSDSDLLEWWMEKMYLYGKPEESWCDEDKSIEEPIITYWCGNEDSDIDGSLVKFIIIASPSRALVEINGELTVVASVKKGIPVKYRVYDPEGKYVSKSGEVTPLKDTVLSVSLNQMILDCKFTLIPNVKNAEVYLSTEPLTDEIQPTIGESSIIAQSGKMIYWRVKAYGYYEQNDATLLTDKDLVQRVTLKKLPYYELKINPTPSNAKVIINEVERKTASIMLGEVAEWSVSADGYYTKSDSIEMHQNTVLDVELEELRTYTLTINPTPSNAKVTIEGLVRNSIAVKDGTVVAWIAEAEDYLSLSGSEKVTSDKVLNVTLHAPQAMQCYYTLDASSNYRRLYLYKLEAAAVGDSIYALGSGSNPGYILESTSLAESSYDLAPAYILSGTAKDYLTVHSCPIPTALTVVPTGMDVNAFGITPIRYPDGDVKAIPPDVTVTVTTNVSASMKFTVTSGTLVSQTSNSITTSYGASITCALTSLNEDYRSRTVTFTADKTKTEHVDLIAKQLVTKSKSFSYSASHKHTNTTGPIASLKANNSSGYTAGSYIVKGPATVTVSASGTSGQSNSRLSIGVGSRIATDAADTNGKGLSIASNTETSSVFVYSISTNGTVEIPEGWYLLYISATLSGSYNGSANINTTMTSKISITCTARYQVYE